MTTDCELCYQRPSDPIRFDGLCIDCGESKDYYDSLTPEEMADEQRMMTDYACDPENQL